MASSIIKYITIKGVLYRIDEYTYRGYAGSTHTGNTMTRVPEGEIENIKNMVAARGEKIKEN